MAAGQKGFLDELRALTGDVRIGYAALAALDSIITKVGQHIDRSVRLFASATPDAFLNLASSAVTLGDGATLQVPPIGGVGLSATFVASTINFGTGAITGGTITLNGTAFATAFAGLTKTNGQFRRFAFAVQADGSVAASSSAEAASQAALADYGAQLAALGGSAAGYVDVVYVTAATQYKTAGSASNVIENGGIFRIPYTSSASNVSTATPTVAGKVSSYFPIIQSAVNNTSSNGVTVTTTDGYLAFFCTTGGTPTGVTLPAASANGGRRAIVEKVDSGAGRVEVTRAGGDTIEGKTSVYLYKQYDRLELLSDGVSKWLVVGESITPVAFSVYADNNSEVTVTSTGGVGATSGIIGFTQEDLDTHAAFASGVFTVPATMGGYYEFSCASQIRQTSQSGTGGGVSNFYLSINSGVSGVPPVSSLHWNGVFGTTDYLAGKRVVALAESDTVSLRFVVLGTGGGSDTLKFVNPQFAGHLLRRIR